MAYITRNEAIEMGMAELCHALECRSREIQRELCVLIAEREELAKKLEGHNMKQAVLLWRESADGISQEVRSGDRRGLGRTDTAARPQNALLRLFFNPRHGFSGS